MVSVSVLEVKEHAIILIEIYNPVSGICLGVGYKVLMKNNLNSCKLPCAHREALGKILFHQIRTRV